MPGSAFCVQSSGPEDIVIVADKAVLIPTRIAKWKQAKVKNVLADKRVLSCGSVESLPRGPVRWTKVKGLPIDFQARESNFNRETRGDPNNTRPCSMKFCDCLDHTETQPGAGCSPAFLKTVKPFKDPFMLTLWYTRAIIRDGQTDCVRFTLDFHRDRRTSWGVPHGICE